VTVLPTVSTIALEVSVALVVSTLTEVSLLLFIDDEESTLAEPFCEESDEPPWPLPLHPATDTVTARARIEILIAFFIVLVLNVLVVNNFSGIMFKFDLGVPGRLINNDGWAGRR
jgi:hypothetical protein